MSLTEYETTVVLRADVGGDAIEATLDKVRDAIRNRGGKLLAINHWGKKKLAYDIAKQHRGVYVHAQYLGAGKLVHEIERNLRISDLVLRFLTIRVADNVAQEAREIIEYVRPSYEDAEEATEEEGQAAEGPSADKGAFNKDESARTDDRARADDKARSGEDTTAEMSTEEQG